MKKWGCRLFGHDFPTSAIRRWPIDLQIRTMELYTRYKKTDIEMLCLRCRAWIVVMPTPILPWFADDDCPQYIPEEE